MTAGQSAFGAVEFSGAAKAKRHRHYPWYPPFIGKSSPCPLAPRRIVALRQTLVRRCHGWLGFIRTCRESANQAHDGGASAFGAGELMAERKKLELGCARLLDLLRQVHGEPRPDSLFPVRV